MKRSDTLLQYRVNNTTSLLLGKRQGTVTDGNCGVRAVKQLLLQHSDLFQTEERVNIGDGEDPNDLGNIRADIARHASIYMNLQQRLNDKNKALETAEGKNGKEAALKLYNFSGIVGAYKEIFNDDINFFKSEVQALIDESLENEDLTTRIKLEELSSKISFLDDWSEIMPLLSKWQLNDIVNMLQTLDFNVNNVLDEHNVRYNKDDNGKAELTGRVIEKYLAKVSSNEEKSLLTTYELIAYLHKYGFIDQKTGHPDIVGSVIKFKHYTKQREISLYNDLGNDLMDDLGDDLRDSANKASLKVPGAHWTASANEEALQPEAFSAAIIMPREEEMQETNDLSVPIETNSILLRELTPVKDQKEVIGIDSPLGKRKAQTQLSKSYIKSKEIGLINTSPSVAGWSLTKSRDKELAKQTTASTKWSSSKHNAEQEINESISPFWEDEVTPQSGNRRRDVKCLPSKMAKNAHDVVEPDEEFMALSPVRSSYSNIGPIESAIRLAIAPPVSYSPSCAEDNLRSAAFIGHLEAVKYFIENRRVNINATDKDGVSVLLAAVIGLRLNVVKYLTQLIGIDLNSTNNKGISPFFAAVAMGDLEMVEYLAGLQGVKLDSTNINGTSQLCMAASNGHLVVVKYLIEKQHANIDAKSGVWGASPLFLAAYKGHLPVVKYLIDSGADVYDIIAIDHSSLIGNLYNNPYMNHTFSSEEKIDILFHIFNQGKNIFYAAPDRLDMFEIIITHHAKEPKNLQKAIQPFLLYEETDQYYPGILPPLNIYSKKILKKLFDIYSARIPIDKLQEQLKPKLLEEMNSINNNILKEEGSNKVTLETLTKSPIQHQVKLLAFYNETYKLHSNGKSGEAIFRENKLIPHSLKISTELIQKAIYCLVARFISKPIVKPAGMQDEDGTKVLTIFKGNLPAALEFEILKYLDFDSVKDTCKRHIKDYKKQKAQSNAVLQDSIMPGVEYHAEDIDMIGEHEESE